MQFLVAQGNQANGVVKAWLGIGGLTLDVFIADGIKSNTCECTMV